MERPRLERVTDLFARATVCTLLTLLSVRILTDYMHTGRLTGLLLLFSESLVVVLTVMRRRATFVNRSLAAGFVTIVSVVGPPILRPGNATSLAPDVLTTLLSAIGLAIVVIGKASLGRSFGLVPANRGIVDRGLYTLVRHPIYAGYLLTHIAFLAQYPTAWNVSVLVIADIALIARALMEERVLSADVAYQSYCQRVGWHLIPGVF